MDTLQQVELVLVAPSHPGNIGAAARALKTMGLNRLTLVQPRDFPHQEANQRSAGAEDVLLQAHVVDNLSDALSGASLVLGTSVREREINWPLYSPRQAADKITQHALQHAENRIAILFGREHSGLTNDELDHCSAQICIPANPQYSSLNLASAVQILAYELRLAALELDGETIDSGAVKPRQQAASQTQRDGHLMHLEQALADLDFAHNKNSPLLMRKLTRLYNKADLTIEEIQILRGILTAIQGRARRSDNASSQDK